MKKLIIILLMVNIFGCAEQQKEIETLAEMACKLGLEINSKKYNDCKMKKDDNGVYYFVITIEPEHNHDHDNVDGIYEGSTYKGN